LQKILIGITLGMILAISILVAFVTLYSGPELSVRISAPESVPIREPFRVSLHLTNPHSEAVIFDSVDIDDSVFETFEVVSVTPEATEDSPVGGFGQQTWFFERTIQPAGEETVEFEFVANSAGSFQLPFDVCNSYQDCSRTPLSIRVVASTR
jgi:hypothetical protein